MAKMSHKAANKKAVGNGKPRTNSKKIAKEKVKKGLPKGVVVIHGVQYRYFTSDVLAKHKFLDDANRALDAMKLLEDKKPRRVPSHLYEILKELVKGLKKKLSKPGFSLPGEPKRNLKAVIAAADAEIKRLTFVE